MKVVLINVCMEEGVQMTKFKGSDTEKTAISDQIDDNNFNSFVLY